MASPRPEGTASPGGRSDGPDDGRRGADDERVTLVRRLGVVAVVVALGGAIVLATGLGGRQTPSPTASPPTPTAISPTGPPPSTSPLPSPPTVTPVIAPAVPSLIAERTWTAGVTIPDPGMPLRTLELHVYRNGRQVLTQRLKSAMSVAVKDIPLKRGINRITVALANDGGEGPRSDAVAVTVDDVAPSIDVKAPREGDVVNASSVTVRGVTDPGQQVTIKNQQRSSVQTATAGADGTFEAEVGLLVGPDTLTVQTADGLGNRRVVVINVSRGDGSAVAVLKISPKEVSLHDLPTKVDVHVMVVDGKGHPVDGAAVTFALAASGLQTVTYTTVTKDGDASWLDIPLPREGAQAGTGLVTAEVLLSDGTIARSTVPFSFTN